MAWRSSVAWLVAINNQSSKALKIIKQIVAGIVWPRSRGGIALEAASYHGAKTALIGMA